MTRYPAREVYRLRTARYIAVATVLAAALAAWALDGPGPVALACAAALPGLVASLSLTVRLSQLTVCSTSYSGVTQVGRDCAVCGAEDVIARTGRARRHRVPGGGRHANPGGPVIRLPRLEKAPPRPRPIALPPVSVPAPSPVTVEEVEEMHHEWPEVAPTPEPVRLPPPPPLPEPVAEPADRGPLCGDCPDHEACMSGMPCDIVRQANATTDGDGTLLGALIARREAVEASDSEPCRWDPVGMTPTCDWDPACPAHGTPSWWCGVCHPSSWAIENCCDDCRARYAVAASEVEDPAGAPDAAPVQADLNGHAEHASEPAPDLNPEPELPSAEVVAADPEPSADDGSCVTCPAPAVYLLVWVDDRGKDGKAPVCAAHVAPLTDDDLPGADLHRWVSSSITPI